jgi:hypothetical protein
MKRFIAWGLLTVLMTAGEAIAKPKSGSNSSSKAKSPPNLSHQYKLSAVASYEAYDGAPAGHCLALIKLKNGTVLPMMCKLDATGIYPLPQSIFAAPLAGEWSMLVEPVVQIRGGQAHALMKIDLKLTDGVLMAGGKKLVKSAVQPKLIKSPK